MLAAHAQMQVGVDGTAQLAGHIHQLAHAGLVQLGKGIVLVDLLVVVGVQELAGVKVIWVRSLVPKEKKSACLATSSAVRAARGISIMVPTRYFMSEPASLMMASAVSTTIFFT